MRGEEKETWKTPRPDVVVPVVNLTLGELGQKDWHGFEVSLGYTPTTCFKIAFKKKCSSGVCALAEDWNHLRRSQNKQIKPQTN